MAWWDANDPEVVHTWERELAREVRIKDPILDPKNKLTGKADSSLIQEKDQLTNGPGKTITTKLRYQLDGRGRVGEETLKGHGEYYKVATHQLTVNIVRHYVETSSPMHDQYVHEDTLMEGKDGLADWFKTRMDFAMHQHAAGFHLITDDAYRLHNEINELHADYIIRPNGKAAGGLSSGDAFDVDLLNLAARRLKLLRPKLRPAQTSMGPRWCVFLSPEQVFDLRESDSLWFNTMIQARQGNELLRKIQSLGEWGDFLFFESEHVPPGINAAGDAIAPNTRRAWIGGAQAVFMAFGRGRAPKGYTLNRYRWDKDSEDFNHKGQMAATTIMGVSRPRYKKPGESEFRENGVLAIETFADADLSLTEAYRDWLNISGVELDS